MIKAQKSLQNFAYSYATNHNFPRKQKRRKLFFVMRDDSNENDYLKNHRLFYLKCKAYMNRSLQLSTRE